VLDDDDDDDNDDDNGDDTGHSGRDSGNSHEKPATCKDYMFHFISFFWKFLFAFVPPTSKLI
jgi:hypothetical protein